MSPTAAVIVIDESRNRGQIFGHTACHMQYFSLIPVRSGLSAFDLNTERRKVILLLLKRNGNEVKLKIN